jgi:hypothetical protein
VEKVSLRFVELFGQHGIAVTQIPRFFPDVNLAHLASPELLASALSSDLLEAACALFGVRREWLEGESDQIYEHRWCYKTPTRFFEELAQLAPAASIAPVRAFTTEKHLDYRRAASQRLELVIAETAGWLGEEEIERYRPFSDGWEWTYGNMRIELKAIIASFGAPVPLYQVSAKEIERLYSGSIFPRSLLRGPLCTHPSLEDFCMPLHRNVHAKEVEELDEVDAYRTAAGLKSILTSPCSVTAL